MQVISGQIAPGSAFYQALRRVQPAHSAKLESGPANSPGAAPTSEPDQDPQPAAKGPGRVFPPGSFLDIRV